MIHVTNILYIIAFACIFALLLIYGFMYVQYKKRVILYWLQFLGSLALLLLTVGLDWYQTLIQLDPSLFILPKKVIDYSALVLCIYAFPNFIHELLGIPISRGTNILRGTLIVVSVLLGIARILFPISTFARLCFSTFLFGTAMYCIIIGLIHRNKIDNRQLKVFLTKYFIFSSLFIPYLLCDIWVYTGPYRISQPLYLIILCAMGILFSFQYLSKPTFSSSEELRAHYQHTYNLTEREGEIFLLLLEGHSNQSVSDTLFISIKTVEAHVSRIFRKIGVNNRRQLLHFVQ